jgi:hypothetical protein
VELLEQENELKYTAALMRERREMVHASFEELPKQDAEERDKLLATGFSDWSRNEFAAFLRACEKFGRDDFERIGNVISR